jgi:hypothetical protein
VRQTVQVPVRPSAQGQVPVRLRVPVRPQDWLVAAPQRRA